ncbi:MAG TPA: hypothetical protein VGC79_22780, partial [Polyangiaceae bacterium]
MSDLRINGVGSFDYGRVWVVWHRVQGVAQIIALPAHNYLTDATLHRTIGVPAGTIVHFVGRLVGSATVRGSVATRSIGDLM